MEDDIRKHSHNYFWDSCFLPFPPNHSAGLPQRACIKRQVPRCCARLVDGGILTQAILDPDLEEAHQAHRLWYGQTPTHQVTPQRQHPLFVSVARPSILPPMAPARQPWHGREVSELRTQAPPGRSRMALLSDAPVRWGPALKNLVV